MKTALIIIAAIVVVVIILVVVVTAILARIDGSRGDSKFPGSDHE